MRSAGSRGLLGGLGVAALAYGAWLLLGTGASNVWGAVVWLVAGVALHDGLLAPATIVVVAAAVRVLPAGSRAWVAAAAIVVGTTTAVAIPVLGRPGAEADNPSLLPRDYVAGLGWIVAAVVFTTTLLALVRARRGDAGGKSPAEP